MRRKSVLARFAAGNDERLGRQMKNIQMRRRVAGADLPDEFGLAKATRLSTKTSTLAGHSHAIKAEQVAHDRIGIRERIPREEDADACSPP